MVFTMCQIGTVNNVVVDDFRMGNKIDHSYFPSVEEAQPVDMMNKTFHFFVCLFLSNFIKQVILLSFR